MNGYAERRRRAARVALWVEWTIWGAFVAGTVLAMWYGGRLMDAQAGCEMSYGAYARRHARGVWPE
jgi:hypothetical protein